MKGQRFGGKPKGWRKPEGVRAQHQVRAYDEEWTLIKDFVKLLRERGVAETKKLLDAVK